MRSPDHTPTPDNNNDDIPFLPEDLLEEVPEKEKPEIPDLSFEAEEIIEHSMASPEHPDRNEDAFLKNKEAGYAAVFDGLGGEGAGDIASGVASEYVEDALKKISKETDVEKVKTALSEALVQADKKIQEIAALSPDKLQNMGTTATVLKTVETPNGKTAVIANIGDSRAYLLRGGKVKPITKDDSVLQEIIDMGMMKEGDDQDLDKKLPDKLKPIFDRVFKARGAEPKDFYTVSDVRMGVSQSLGKGKSVEPNLFTVELQPGDKIMLSSDGIHDNMTDAEIEKILKGKKDEDELESEIIKKAHDIEMDKSNPRRKFDDKTAIIFNF